MSCSSCKGDCPTPTACEVPAPTPAPRPPRLPRMFVPTYELDGPVRRPGWIRRALRTLFPFLNR